MTPALERVQHLLKRLPGVGRRAAERIALHLLVERPQELPELLAALEHARGQVGQCPRCGHLADAGEPCSVCADPRRSPAAVCVVEQIPDLLALERAGGHRGLYHVLHGRLSPLRGVGPDQLNVAALEARLAGGEVEELILALANDVESEATCHYLQESLLARFPAVRVTRIGFGLPSGGGLLYADPMTLRSALEARRPLG